MPSPLPHRRPKPPTVRTIRPSFYTKVLGAIAQADPRGRIRVPLAFAVAKQLVALVAAEPRPRAAARRTLKDMRRLRRRHR